MTARLFYRYRNVATAATKGNNRWNLELVKVISPYVVFLFYFIVGIGCNPLNGCFESQMCPYWEETTLSTANSALNC